MAIVNRSTLLRTLEQINAGLSSKELLEQSNCVVFKGGHSITFNDLIAIRAPSGLPENFTGAVPANALVRLLQKIPDKELEIEGQENELYVKGKGRWAKLRLEKEILLPIKHIDTPKEWHKLDEEFAQAINTVQSCA